MARSQNPVAKLYQTVIEDVINNVREAFLDDGVDEQVLHELKQIWENKLEQTKAVSSPVLGDRAARPPMFTYVAQPSTQQGVSQPVMYQTLQTQNVQLSGAAQQARLAIPAVYQQQQGGSLVQLPTQQGQQVYAAYQPVVIQQQGIQIAPHQARSAGASGQTLVLTTTTQANISQQQQVPSQQQQKQPSAIIQVDGSSEHPADEDVPCSSGLRFQGSSTKIHKLKKHPVTKTEAKRKRKKVTIIFQVDGGCDTSSSEEDDDNEEDDDDDDDDEDDDNEDEETNEEEEQNDEEPLCSDDDDSDQDAKELFDTDNVVVCQYDKIHRAKAKWKFNLKVGIMNLKSKDYVFQKATGEAEW